MFFYEKNSIKNVGSKSLSIEANFLFLFQKCLNFFSKFYQTKHKVLFTNLFSSKNFSVLSFSTLAAGFKLEPIFFFFLLKRENLSRFQTMWQLKREKLSRFFSASTNVCRCGLVPVFEKVFLSLLTRALISYRRFFWPKLTVNWK